MEKRKCLLSVAMIVKDEEHNIRRALESIKDVVDEIIVVDTGSKDRTPEIAKEYTDKVYFHEWKNDFSEARNYSLKFPTCEWVLILDADEEASEEFRNNIRNFLENLPESVNTVYVPTLSYLDWDFKRQEIASTPRIFRNGTVYYKNIVHNQPVYKPKVTKFPYKIIHYGYIWTRSLRKKKYERTKNLILKHLERVRGKDKDEEVYYLVQLYKTECIGGKPYTRRKIGWETYNAILQYKKVPHIALEFLFLFGLDMVRALQFELAEQCFEAAINAYPEYPDPYYGMELSKNNQDEYEQVLEWYEKFIEKYRVAIENIEKFEWTIMSMKYVQTAHFMAARSALRLRELEKFNEYVERALSESLVEDPTSVIRDIINTVTSLEKEEFEKITESVYNLIKFSLENSVKVVYDPIIETFAKHGIVPEINIPPTSTLAELILNKIKNPREDYFEKIMFNGKPVEEFLESSGVPGAIILYSYYKEKLNFKELIKKIKQLLDSVESDELKGIFEALIADEFLKLGNVREAIIRYRRAMEYLPEISTHVKPIVEDLKVTLDTKEIEGLYDSLLEFYSKNKELIIDATKYVDKEVLKRYYLVSDFDYAKYLSALTCGDNDLSRKLLLSIKNKKLFPLYYYRLAKTYEEDDKETAFKYHNKAVEENPYIADLRVKHFTFAGMFRVDKVDFIKKSDPIMWVGNISERYTTVGLIHPVRAWRKHGEEFFYADPFPAKQAIESYRKYSKDFITNDPLDLEKNFEDIIKIIYELPLNDINFISDVEKQRYKDLFEKHGINISDESDNLVVIDDVQINPYLSEEIAKFKARNLYLFYFEPDLDDRENLVWFNPAFRILRTTEMVKKMIKNTGYDIKGGKYINKFLRLIHATLKGD